jgi:hypothetical protein
MMQYYRFAAAQTTTLHTALAMHRGAGADGMHLAAATAVAVLHSNSSSCSSKSL